MFRGVVPSPQRQNSRVRSQFWLIALLAGILPAWGLPQGSTLVGQVVDARTGAPLEKVLVVIEDPGKSSDGREGRFGTLGLKAPIA